MTTGEIAACVIAVTAGFLVLLLDWLFFGRRQ